MERRAHRHRAKAPFSHRSWDKGWAFSSSAEGNACGPSGSGASEGKCRPEAILLSTPAQERHIRSLAAGVATAQAPFFGKPELAVGGNCSRLDKLQLAWSEAALPRYAAGHGRSEFAAACLAVSRYLATAGLFDGTQLHGTPARRDIPRRPSNLTFVAVPKLKRNTSRRPPSALTIATHGALFCSRTIFAQVLADSETLEQKRELNRERFDLLTATKYIVQKIQSRRGSSHGLTVPQEHHKARTSKRRVLKKGFDSIHDRFMTDEKYRAS